MAKIIVADDDAGLREFYRDVIQENSKEIGVDEVDCGKDFVDRVRNGEYMLGIIDYDMGPEMKGTEAVRQVREFNQGLLIYVISGSDVEEEAMEAGANGYLHKPVNFVNLIDLIENIVN